MIRQICVLTVCQNTCLPVSSMKGYSSELYFPVPGHIAQSVTCLTTDADLTADPGVANSIPAWSHTFVGIDHEIISMVIFLPSTDSFKKGCGQLQANVVARITGCPGKSVFR